MKPVTIAPSPYSLDETLRLHEEMTLKNWWDGGEILRYVLLHMAAFFPHAYIHRDGPINWLPVDLRPDIAEMTVESREGPVTLDEYVQTHGHQLNGLIVLHDGKIVYEAYPRMRSYDKHSLMSITKAFVGLVIRQLCEEGRIDVDDPVEQYLPELQGSGWQGVAVRDVLDMASGIDCLEMSDGAITDPDNPYYHYEASAGWRQSTGDTPRSTYDYIPTLEQRIEPGTQFEYSSVNSFVLSWLAEQITGLPLNELITERIWRHIGAEADALLAVSEAGAPSADGGISATLRDLARFGLLFTASWPVISDTQIVSTDYLHSIREDGRPDVFQAGYGPWMSRMFSDEDQPAHNCWHWDHVWEDGAFHKGGYAGQGLYVSPRADVVISFFGYLDSNNSLHETLRWVRQIERQCLAGAEARDGES